MVGVGGGNKLRLLKKTTFTSSKSTRLCKGMNGILSVREEKHVNAILGRDETETFPKARPRQSTSKEREEEYATQLLYIYIK